MIFRKLSLIFAFLLPVIIHAQNEKTEQAFREKGEIYFSFDIQSREELGKITRMISIDQVKGNTVKAYANQKEFGQFLTLNYPYQILKHPGEQEHPNMLNEVDISQPSAWDYYPTYTAYESMMAQFQAAYPNLCHVDTLTTLPSGRRLIMAKITNNVNTTANKPQFYYNGSIHGDETTGYILLLRLIDYLLTNYGVNAQVTNLVNNIEIYICPLSNPDGTYHGGNATVGGAIRYNNNYIDLNRNFPDPQDGEHPDGNAWQPETVAFMNFATNHHINMSANLHGGSEVINYPWDTWPQLHADDNWCIFASREYADTVHAHSVTGYLTDLDNGITNGYAWYQITGGRQDYMTFFHHDREFTMELSYTKNPAASQLPNFWNYNYRSLLNYINRSLYGIRGVVTDTLTGQPLRAKVFINGHDFDSSFVYSSLPIGNYYRYIAPGTWNLTFSAPGYYTKTISNITSGNYTTQVVDVQLMPVGTSTSITGKLRYANAVQTPLSGVTVQLKTLSGAVAYSATTSSTGDYAFPAVNSGTYRYDFVINKPVGGINSADALADLRHFVGLDQLTGIRFLAGDVDGSHAINATDAMLIQQKFVNMISSFGAGPWQFTKDTLTVSGGSITHHLTAICTGDSDGSYIPANDFDQIFTLKPAILNRITPVRQPVRIPEVLEPQK